MTPAARQIATDLKCLSQAHFVAQMNRISGSNYYDDNPEAWQREREAFDELDALRAAVEAGVIEVEAATSAVARITAELPELSKEERAFLDLARRLSS